MTDKLRIAIVGAGSRHKMYRDSVIKDYSDQHEIVALCDTNSHRLNLSAQTLQKSGTNGVATYEAADFDKLIVEQKPNTIVVTTPDFLHDVYIEKAFAAGCNVICEKPMTISLEKLKNIVDAQKKYDKSITVTFNYRYPPI